MDGYDWEWRRGGRRFRGGYGADYRMEGFGRGPSYNERGRDWRGDRGVSPEMRGGYGFDYGRGYGGGHPGRAGGDARWMRQAPWHDQAGYDRDQRGPFLPDEAYRRHPEIGRPTRHDSELWERRMRMDAARGYDDDELEQMVRESLYQDPWLDADSIDVEVENGVVRLSGEVADFMDARYAWDDAWETDGVRGVISHLTVRVDEVAAEGSATGSTAQPKRPAGRKASKKG
jgi:hypothetical protein